MNRKQRRRRANRRASHAAHVWKSHGEWLTDRQAVPLLWRPWYLERLERVDGAAWVWSIVQNACELPDPADFPSVAMHLTPRQHEMLARYASTAERLVATTVLNAGASVRIDLLTGEVTKTVPPVDATIGFAALLRQLSKPDEEASFDRIRKTLARGAHEAEAAEASAALLMWKRAHQTLLRHHLRRLIHNIAVEAGVLTDADHDGGRIAGAEEITPRELIDVFLNGDYLHWGRDRNRLQQWAASERDAAGMEFEMRNDAHVLAHFYAGFAGIVRQLVTVPEPAETT